MQKLRLPSMPTAGLSLFMQNHQGLKVNGDGGCSKFCVTLKITDRCEHPVVLQNGWTAEIALNS
ncbi:hypothetical protein ACFFLG_00875, partial [Shewanella indica]|uniref:hypothetical protein n=1 Tax=Shewanella indica TaxID=768528 RepID=UPI0035F0F5F7